MEDKYVVEEKGQKKVIGSKEFNEIQSNPDKHLKEVKSEDGTTSYKVQERLLG